MYGILKNLSYTTAGLMLLSIAGAEAIEANLLPALLKRLLLFLLFFCLGRYMEHRKRQATKKQIRKKFGPAICEGVHFAPTQNVRFK